MAAKEQNGHQPERHEGSYFVKPSAGSRSFDVSIIGAGLEELSLTIRITPEPTSAEPASSSAFPDFVRRIRKNAGLSQGELGQMTGFSQSAISRIEHGVKPSPEQEAELRMHLTKLEDDTTHRDIQDKAGRKAPRDRVQQHRKASAALDDLQLPDRSTIAGNTLGGSN
jgi:transcriptional regulator with XRE-family HTH domain